MTDKTGLPSVALYVSLSMLSEKCLRFQDSPQRPALCPSLVR